MAQHSTSSADMGNNRGVSNLAMVPTYDYHEALFGQVEAGGALLSEGVPGHTAFLNTEGPKLGGKRSGKVDRPLPGAADHRLGVGNLADVNDVVKAAVATWSVTDRVRRLALPSLLYSVNDLLHMRFVLVDDAEGTAIAVAAWEEIVDGKAIRAGANVQLHGLYVRPEWQNQGVGSSLLEFVGLWVGMHDKDGITVRAWPDSTAFFRSQGFEPVHQEQAAETDARLLWRSSRWMH